MAQIITTKYLGPTNARGSRIQAKSASGVAVTVSYDHALNSDENHAAAAEALCKKLRWHGRWVMGSSKDGHVFVQDVGAYLQT